MEKTLDILPQNLNLATDHKIISFLSQAVKAIDQSIVFYQTEWCNLTTHRYVWLPVVILYCKLWTGMNGQVGMYSPMINFKVFH